MCIYQIIYCKQKNVPTHSDIIYNIAWAETSHHPNSSRRCRETRLRDSTRGGAVASCCQYLTPPQSLRSPIRLPNVVVMANLFYMMVLSVALFRGLCSAVKVYGLICYIKKLIHIRLN